MSEKKVLFEQIYTVKKIVADDGTFKLIRMNDGFDAIELLGMLQLLQMEILAQIKGEIRPDIVKREVVEDDEKDEIKLKNKIDRLKK